MTTSDTDRTGQDDGATRELPQVAPWLVVSAAGPGKDVPAPSLRRLMTAIAVGAVLVLVAVSVLGIIAARSLAERQSVNDAANTVDLLAEAVVQPALTDGIATRDPAALARLHDALTDYLQTSSLVRVKLWAADGTVLYSDESRLIGQRFTLDDEETEVFRDPRTIAEVSDLDAPENQYERGQGKLLEAYRPVWTPDGTPLLFETYSPYDEVDTRAGQLWRGFAGVTISSLLVFVALMIPLLWQLVSRVRAASRQREELLQRAVDASAEERERIAGTLHDGVVQELAGASFTLSGAATRAETIGESTLAEDLRQVAGTVRDSIGGLRTLLVDIYPETLETAGLVEVLRDLASTMRSRGIEVHLDLPETDPALGIERDRLVFRTVHECFQNVRKHSGARHVWLRLGPGEAGFELTVADDGAGFDPAAVLAHPEEGHFGLRLLAESSARAGAELAVSSAPGAGCTWRLRL